MVTKARKISQTDWETHKDTILNLYIDRYFSMKELIETMERDHGFTATISQYEAQFRIWKARKNVTIRQWDRTLETIDSLASRGIKSRVLVSNQVVQMTKIRRARRYRQAHGRPIERPPAEVDSRDDAVDDESTNNVVIETQDTSGQWSRYTTQDNEDTASSQQQLPFDRPEQANTMPYLQLQSLMPGPMPDGWFATGDDEGPVQTMDLSLVEYGAYGFPQASYHHEAFTGNAGLYVDSIYPGQEMSFSQPPLQPVYLPNFPPAASHLNDLPFEQFERELALKRLQSARSPSPIPETGLFSGVQSSVLTFAIEAATVLARSNLRPFRENVDNTLLKLRALHSSMPRSQQSELSQMTKATELHRLLLYSCANGFMGLDGVPIEAVFKFLNQKGNVTSLLSRMFLDNPGYAAKSIAENLFRAAIESGDHHATRSFLQSQLVDIDKTLFIVNGEKYTPLERAAEFQRLEVVEELLRFGPEVNKTLFDRRSKWGPIKGALGLLIEGAWLANTTKRNHSPFTPEYLKAVDHLLDAGAKIHRSSIHYSLRRFVQMDLAKKLLHRVAPSDHYKAFLVRWSDASILVIAMEELKDEEAREIIFKVLSDCEQTGCDRCLDRFSDELNTAIVAAAKRGHVQLVRSHFQYAESKTRILSAAIMSSNGELIDFVLDQEPDIRFAPPENIEASIYRGTYPRYSTPLAEAIYAENHELIRKLENEGALENFQIGFGRVDRFSSALEAATKMRDVRYVRKLLQHYPNASGFSMRKALRSAIENCQEDLVRLLLDMGAEYDTELMLAPLLIKTYIWGNQSILSDLTSTFPDVKIDYLDKDSSFFQESICDTGAMFEFFHRSGRITTGAMDTFLRVAIEQGNDALLQHLLEIGKSATKIPVTEFGSQALIGAIRQSPSNIKIFEMLLACTAVDVKSLVKYEVGFEELFSPLAIAIQREASDGCSDFPLTTRLFDAGCDINQIACIQFFHRGSRRVNRTPILLAIERRSNSMVQFLMDRGADINKKAIHGIKWTPLQAAAEEGSLELVELLLRNGAHADDKAAARRGATALQCAAMSGNCSIAALLLNSGASLYSPPSMFEGRTPIQAAAERGRLDMIRFLWNASLARHGIGFPFEDCSRAMDLAEENGHMGCRDLILELAVENGLVPMIG
ncbi:ankyrin [Hypoxylon sp. FL1284]|nr:ankyrin [Hypoxylon sp. FL1284]